MNRSEENVIYEFEGFELDIARRRLTSANGESIELFSRGLDTLICLVENQGRLVDKETLMRTVWPDTVVEENNLNQAIATLRKALGDSPRERRFIATDPGRGYRFVADIRIRDKKQAVQETVESASALPARKLNIVAVSVLAVAAIYLIAQDAFRLVGPSIITPEPSEQSIAVLPFTDMSPDGDQEYFSDGIAEELTNHLSKLPGLRVAGRTSSFSFKGKNEDLRVIGEKLNVANVLEGSVRKAAGRVRITVNLVKASDGLNLWSQSYERDLDDIFAIQEETAESVANALSVTLGVGNGDFAVGGTRNFDAYDAYLTGASLWRQADRDSMLRAIEEFEKAVSLDPEYAQAWSALASIYDFAGSFFAAGRTEEFMRKSAVAASRAIEIAPEASFSLLLKARLHEINYEWLEMEQVLLEVDAREPMNFVVNLRLGDFNLNVGRPHAAIGYFRHMKEIEPLLLLPVQKIVGTLGTLGEYDAALEEYKQSKDLIGNHALTHAVATTLTLRMNDRALMEDYLDKLVADPPGPIRTQQFTRTMRSLLDSPEQARSELRRFYNDPTYQLPLLQNAMAIWASFFGDDELALEILKNLYEKYDFFVFSIWQQMHQEIRQRPEFKDLVRDLGLVDYWRTTGNWGDFCRPIGTEDFECE